MKVLLLISSIILTTLAVSKEELWIKFKNDHGKFFTSLEEENRRFKIFQSNLREIEEHNAKYDKNETTYYKGINQFTDMTKDEFVKRVLGKPRTRPQREDGRPFKANFTDDDDIIPESIDWRQRNVVSAVGNQKCTDFWAYSATGMLEGQYALYKNIGVIELSKQNLIDCSQPYGNSGCDGGYSYATYQYLKANGIETESDYPYEGVTGNCRYDGSKKLFTFVAASYLREKDEDELKMATGSVGPIDISLDATNIGSYAGGIFQDSQCSQDVMNFAALVVGYGNENGNEYWIVKNCFGPNWGEQGYIRIQKNVNTCGIASDANYAIIESYP